MSLFDFDTEKAARSAARQLMQEGNYFHLRSRFFRISRHDEPTVIEDIPTQLKTDVEMRAWARTDLRPNYRDRWARIAVRGSRLMVHIHHAAWDGGHHLQVADRLIKGKSLALPELPVSTFHSFWKEIRRADVQETERTHRGITRIFPVGAEHGAARFVCDEVWIPTQELACYDRATKRPKHLTEQIWSAVGTAAWALNGGQIDRLGLSQIVDVRRLSGRQGGFDWQNCISSIYPNVAAVPNETLGDVTMRLREDLTRRSKRGEHFGFLKGLIARCCVPLPVLPVVPGLSFELSHLGKVELRRPLTGFWGECMVPGTGPWGMVSMCSMTVDDIPSGQSNFGLVMGCRSTDMGREEKRVLVAMVDYAMRRFGENVRICDAVQELRERFLPASVRDEPWRPVKRLRRSRWNLW